MSKRTIAVVVVLQIGLILSWGVAGAVGAVEGAAWTLPFLGLLVASLLVNRTLKRAEELAS